MHLNHELGVISVTGHSQRKTTFRGTGVIFMYQVVLLLSSKTCPPAFRAWESLQILFRCIWGGGRRTVHIPPARGEGMRGLVGTIIWFSTAGTFTTKISQSGRGRVNFCWSPGHWRTGIFFESELGSRVFENLRDYLWAFYIISHRQELVGGVREQHIIRRDRVVWWDNNPAKASGMLMLF